MQGGYTPRTLCESVITRLTPLSFSKKAKVLALLGKSLDHLVRRAFRCDICGYSVDGGAEGYRGGEVEGQREGNLRASSEHAT